MPNHDTDVEKLREIIDDLPDSSDHAGMERREYSLTKGDVLLIYKIAKIAGGHDCPFQEEESRTLQSVAKNINRTHTLAYTAIVLGLVGATLSGLLLLAKYIIVEFVKHGGSLK